MSVLYLDPREQRARVIAQIATWRERHRRKPSYLLEVQLAALLRLVDRLDDMIEAHRLERQDAADQDAPAARPAYSMAGPVPGAKMPTGIKPANSTRKPG
jgi:hypothetical protein